MTDQTPPQSPNHRDKSQSLFVVAIGGAVTIAIAVGANAFLGTRAFDKFTAAPAEIAIGVLATLPLAGFLWYFLRTSYEPLAAFRRSQVEFFADIGFSFTWPRIVVIGLMAGVSEELLFRGVLQPWASRYIPVFAAIVLTNILFGLLHARTRLYALIAGVLGTYLGALYWWTDGLTAPVITHTLYDILALYMTRRAIDALPERAPDLEQNSRPRADP